MVFVVFGRVLLGHPLPFPEISIRCGNVFGCFGCFCLMVLVVFGRWGITYHSFFDFHQICWCFDGFGGFGCFCLFC